jgi:hypothetical protein
VNRSRVICSNGNVPYVIHGMTNSQLNVPIQIVAPTRKHIETGNAVTAELGTMIIALGVQGAELNGKEMKSQIGDLPSWGGTQHSPALRDTLRVRCLLRALGF